MASANVEWGPRPALAPIIPERPMAAVSTVAPLCMTATSEKPCRYGGNSLLNLLSHVVQHHARLRQEAIQASTLEKLLRTRGRTVRHRLTPAASLGETLVGRLQFLLREGK